MQRKIRVPFICHQENELYYKRRQLKCMSIIILGTQRPSSLRMEPGKQEVWIKETQPIYNTLTPQHLSYACVVILYTHVIRLHQLLFH